MVAIGLLQIVATPRRQKESASVRFTSRSSVKTPDSFLPSYNAVYQPLVQTQISLADHPVWTRQKAISVMAAPEDFSRTSFFFFPYIIFDFCFLPPRPSFLAKVLKNKTKKKRLNFPAPPPPFFPPQGDKLWKCVPKFPREYRVLRE